MNLRIDRHLYLVVPIYRDEEGGEVIAYVHSTPLSEEIVDHYFMTLGQTYSAIFSQGLGLPSGPGHAMRVLRHIATERGVWQDNARTGEVGVERGLMEEIKRLTNVAALTKDGKWEQLPLSVAVDRNVISREDMKEVENAIVFFIAAYATLNRAQRQPMLEAAAGLWGAQISSLTFTAFCNSLKISTTTASSGEKSPASVKEKSGHASAMMGGKAASVPV